MTSETLLCIFFPFSRCSAVFSRQIQYSFTYKYFIYKNAKNMYVSVCKIRLFPNIAYKGPDLRENLQSTITFADSKTENKPVKASTTIQPGPDCIICRFLFVCKLSDSYHLSTALFQQKFGRRKNWDYEILGCRTHHNSLSVS